MTETVTCMVSYVFEDLNVDLLSAKIQVQN